MKQIIVLLLLSIATNLIAQEDTLYFDDDWQVTTKDSASFFASTSINKTAITGFEKSTSDSNARTISST